MQKFQARRNARRAIYSIPSLLVLFALLLFLAHGVWGAYQKYALTEQLLAEAEQENAKLVDRTSTLQDENARLSTDRGVEEEVRKNFQVAKPGEEVVILLDATGSAATTTPPEKPWWKWW